MDNISKQFLKENQGPLEPKQTQMIIPGQQATLMLDMSPVNNNIHHHVNLHFYDHHLETRFRKQTDISTQYQKNIQWRAFERAFRKAPEREKLAVFNLIHGK